MRHRGGQSVDTRTLNEIGFKIPWACTPCVNARGYEQEDLIDGTVITGASVMHARIKEGAATLSL